MFKIPYNSKFKNGLGMPGEKLPVSKKEVFNSSTKYDFLATIINNFKP